MLSSTSTSRRILGVLAAALLLTGCADSNDNAQPTAEQSLSAEPTPPISATAVAPPTPLPSVIPAPAPSTTDDLTASFNALAASLPAGEVGVALFNGQQTFAFGSWTNGAAWSTIKVPLAIAALAVDPIAAEQFMAQAITQSDNSAADALWTMLGDPHTAASAVDTVLREGGDTVVAVEAQQIYPPYSPYGQTLWPQDQAALFAFGLPCIPGAHPVLAQMRYLGANQQWGLAPYPDVAAKGGWGPGIDGRYLVRQLALVTNNSGTFGVSLAAKPDDGSFETGKAMLDIVGAWIDKQRDTVPGGRCH